MQGIIPASSPQTLDQYPSVPAQSAPSHIEDVPTQAFNWQREAPSTMQPSPTPAQSLQERVPDQTMVSQQQVNQPPVAPVPVSSPINPNLPAQLPAAATSRRINRKKLGFILVGIVVVVALLAVAGFSLLPILGVGKVSQSPITNTAINTTVDYAGVDVTILKAQQSQSFINDPVAQKDGTVRLLLQVHNTGSQSIVFNYNQLASIILPDGKALTPIYTKGNTQLAAGASQTGTLDYAVPQTTPVSQLVFRLGTAATAQMSVPLTGHANVSQYNTKTVTVNQQPTCSGENTCAYGLDWEVTKVSSSLHMGNQQANSGMRFVTVNLSVSNTLTEEVISGSPFTYMNVKAGSLSLNPVESTLPVAFPSGANGTTGTVTFQIPQNVTTWTLTLSPQSSDGFDPATFTIHA
jgi:archaellum component FlaG (FlaF/FlaG flagellin family)